MRYKGTEEEKRALDAFIKLRRAVNSLDERIHGHLPKWGLNETRFAVLEVLAALGPLCQKDIGQKILKSRANITLVVDQLEEQGLVKRERSSEDRRYLTVHLTPKGEELISEVFPHQMGVITEEFAVLSPSEQEELARLCRKLGLAGKD